MEQDKFPSLEKELFIKEFGRKNLGWKTNRLSYDPNDLENAFSSLWVEENKKNARLNYGQGLLQDLFGYKTGFNNGFLLKINDRDRLIAATLVQWMGTNCGLSFLREALSKSGYKIVKK